MRILETRRSGSLISSAPNVFRMDLSFFDLVRIKRKHQCLLADTLCVPKTRVCRKPYPHLFRTHDRRGVADIGKRRYNQTNNARSPRLAICQQRFPKPRPRS